MCCLGRREERGGGMDLREPHIHVLPHAVAEPHNVLLSLRILGGQVDHHILIIVKGVLNLLHVILCSQFE